VLADVLDSLVCPQCGESLQVDRSALRCPAGHTFDIARQGYVNFLPGNARPGTADTAAMVAARRDFLESGRYAPLTKLVADAAAGTNGLIVDAGGGTGYYLSAVLEHCPRAIGLTFDLSKYAARLAARGHSRAAAAVVDVWQPLPLRSGSAALVMNVFAPRNAAEFHRVLRPGSRLLVVTPLAGHLAELAPLGLLSVDEHKSERLRDTLDAHFEFIDMQERTTALRLTGTDIERVVSMGPSAHHVDAGLLRERIAGLPDRVTVTASFVLSTFEPRSGHIA